MSQVKNLKLFGFIALVLFLCLMIHSMVPVSAQFTPGAEKTIQIIPSAGTCFSWVGFEYECDLIKDVEFAGGEGWFSRSIEFLDFDGTAGNVYELRVYDTGIPVADDLEAVYQVVEVLSEEPMPRSRIGNQVWFEMDGNGRRDRNERNNGLSGVQMTLSTCNGVEVDSTNTNAKGQYKFRNMLPGSYQVSMTFDYVADVTDYSMSPANNTNDKRDSDGENEVTECTQEEFLSGVSCTMTAVTACFDLELGERNNTIDFGVTHIING